MIGRHPSITVKKMQLNTEHICSLIKENLSLKT